jgi:hypothetical protein
MMLAHRIYALLEGLIDAARNAQLQKLYSSLLVRLSLAITSHHDHLLF